MNSEIKQKWVAALRGPVMTGKETIAQARAERMGFLTKAEIAAIANDPETRLTMLLVRTNGGRFLTPAQNVAHYIGIIERERPAGRWWEFRRRRESTDYVRDVSIPAREART